MKKIFLFLLASIAINSISVQAQDCELPTPFSGNTGNNMTVLFTPVFLNSIDISDDAYIVALTGSGLVVGTVYKNDPNGGVGLSQGQGTIAVWGDDADNSSPEIDGAVEPEEINFQLVDNGQLYDLTLPVSISYVAQTFVPVTGAGSLQLADCTGSTDDVPGCTDSTALNYDAAANTDDGSCIAVVNGCTDATANNFNSSANTDDGSCTFGSNDGVEIVFPLSAGWNMVGFTGPQTANIVTAMDAALDNGAGTANTFEVIKNVSGKFWSDIFAQISEFTPGEGYMMFVNGTPTSVNFQKESGYVSGIEFPLSSGWNMVAFTGDVNSETNIVTAMDAALENGAGTANTFEVIKKCIW